MSRTSPSCWERGRPFIFCGNGDRAGLHRLAYNFKDEVIVYGSSYIGTQAIIKFLIAATFSPRGCRLSHRQRLSNTWVVENGRLNVSAAKIVSAATSTTLAEPVWAGVFQGFVFGSMDTVETVAEG